MRWDAIVLGGGLYGCKVALALRAAGVKKVMLVEPGHLGSGATTVNQNRVHGGYHYPRSIQTADSAQKNYNRFLIDHATVIEANDQHIYGIGEGSFTTPTEFEAAMKRVGAPLTECRRPDWCTNRVLATYVVEEVVFNIRKMRLLLKTQLQQAGITRMYNYGRIIYADDRSVVVALTPELLSKKAEFVEADYVFNCTYGHIDEVGARVKTPLQKEWCEVALVMAPKKIQKMDITIMDGPFWSLMKYPSEVCHALTHVTHTVHDRWFPPKDQAPELLRGSNFDNMIDDASRYVPIMQDCRRCGSLWTTRVVLADNEPDDGRPILWEHDERSPRLISILGSKFNSVYDAMGMIEKGEWRQPGHKLNVRREGRRALVGYTGFVGKNLDAPGRFTDRYNRANLDELGGRYRQLVLAVPSGTKWRVNYSDEGAEQDMADIVALRAAIQRCEADEVLMVSTIDVTEDPGLYGRLRAEWEKTVRDWFPYVKVLRLPGLYGPGLKKNAVWDVMNGYAAPYHPDSTFQWFDVRDTWDEFKKVSSGEMREILPEPVTVGLLYGLKGSPIPHECLFYGKAHYHRGPYTIHRNQVIAGLQAFLGGTDV